MSNHPVVQSWSEVSSLLNMRRHVRSETGLLVSTVRNLFVVGEDFYRVLSLWYGYFSGIRVRGLTLDWVCMQVAHARLNKQGHRPLGRTQSAPLPLGHPMLTGGALTVVPPSNPSYEDYQHTTKHNLLKQVAHELRVSSTVRWHLLEKLSVNREWPAVTKVVYKISAVTALFSTNMIGRTPAFAFADWLGPKNRSGHVIQWPTLWVTTVSLQFGVQTS